MAYFFTNTATTRQLELDNDFSLGGYASRGWLFGSAAYSFESQYLREDMIVPTTILGVPTKDTTSPLYAPDGPLFANITGTTGNDILNGTGAVDTINGLGGNDILNGLGGNDILNGGLGQDQVNGGDGDDLLIDDQGNTSASDADVYDGGAGIDTLEYTFGPLANVFAFNLATGEQTFIGIVIDTFSNIENLTVNGAVIVIGDGADNVLTIIGTGNNTIDGGAGNDTIIDGGGDDTLIGGLGTDLLSYESSLGGVAVDLSNAASQNTVGAGTDTISGFENLTGSDFGDVLTGDSGNNTINGGAGIDLINGGSGDDTLNGGDGADTLNGGIGNDTLNGGDGADTLNGGDGNDTLSGGDGGNTLNGGAGNDTLIQDGSDSSQLNGGAGDDNLIVASASLQLGGAYDGGTGTDTFDLSFFNFDGSIINLTTGIWNDGTFDFLTLVNIENVIGTDGVDTITGNSSVNVLNGGDGDDTFLGITSSLTAGDIYDGGAGSNTLDLSALSADITLNADSNSANGFAALSFDLTAGGRLATFSSINNFIFGSGDDTIYMDSGLGTGFQGGAGDDQLFITSGGIGNGQVIDGGADTDTLDLSFNTSFSYVTDLSAGTLIEGGSNVNTLTSIENVNGNDLADTITGDANDNVLNGNGGDDVIIGGGGDDTLNGGAGDDILTHSGDGVVTLDGGADDDTLIIAGFNPLGSLFDGGAGDDTFDLSFFNFSGTIIDLTVQSWVDAGGVVAAIANIENIIGTGGNDTITGSSAINVLNGGGGDDTFLVVAASLTAGDVYDGGAGTDTLDLSALSTDITLNADQNVVNGFAAQGFDLTAGGQLATFTNINNFIFGSGNDVIYMNIENDFHAGAGNDQLFIESIGIFNGDIIDGGTGIDTLDLSMGVGRTYVTDLIANTLDENGGAFVSTLAGIENVNGNDQNDVMTGDANDNVLNGNGGDDIINGGDGNDTITGGAGADTLSGGLGDDTFLVTVAGTSLGDIYNGDSGTDTLNLSALSVDITLNAVFSTVNGFAGNGFDETAGGQLATFSSIDNFIFGSGNDIIYMHISDDFDAGAGNDQLFVDNSGIANGDVYDGGADVDTLDLTLNTFSYVTDLSAGTLVEVGGAFTATITSIENVNGNDEDDTITGNGLANVLNGNGGDDTVNAGGGDDTVKRRCWR